MTIVRAFAVFAVLSLLTVACGSRITEQQRQFVLSGSGGQAAGDGTAPLGGGTPSEVAGGGNIPGGGGANNSVPGGGAGTATPPPGSGGGDDPGTGGDGGDQPGDGGGDQPGDGGGDQPGGGQQPTDTRAAPPGGNGGETDTGVTEDTIIVGNASDVSGAVPGLFQDARDAVNAYVAYFSSTEGTIYGRQLQFLFKDTKLNSNGNRNAYLELCEDAFATVGSMSAFEQGAIGPITDCDIPDLRTASVNNEVMDLPTVYPADASRVAVQPMAEYQYWKRIQPQAVRKAAYLYIDSETTRFQTKQVVDATRKIGYHWEMHEPIDIAETNYVPFVLEMEDRGVQYVTFQGAYQQAARLARDMQSQGFKPKIYALQSNAYTPSYIEDGQSAVEGMHIAVPSVILEEINQHEELQLYATWLNQVAPGKKPSGLGIYAWSAARMFVDAVKAVGPNLTRKGLIEELKKVHAFDGNGLLPEQDIGGKYPADCVVVVKVQNQRFVRAEPSGGGFSCSKPVEL